MIDGQLEYMLKMQRELQEEIYGNDVFGIAEYQSGTPYVRDMVLATISELNEILEETEWKPLPPHLNNDTSVNIRGMKREIVDVWMFLMNIMIASGMSADELFAGFMGKHAEVKKRLHSHARIPN